MNDKENKEASTSKQAPESTNSIGAALLAEAANDPIVAALPENERNKAIELLDDMFSRMESAKWPDVTGCVIEMDLQKGGHIKVVEAMGYHSMVAKRQMKLYGKNGDIDELCTLYTFVACADIDGEPMTMADMQTKITTRDLNVLISYFTRVNLL